MRVSRGTIVLFVTTPACSNCVQLFDEASGALVRHFNVRGQDSLAVMDASEELAVYCWVDGVVYTYDWHGKRIGENKIHDDSSKLYYKLFQLMNGDALMARLADKKLEIYHWIC